ncbi:MAG: energy transducer TonB [Thiotrichales bacterium]
MPLRPVLLDEASIKPFAIDMAVAQRRLPATAGRDTSEALINTDVLPETTAHRSRLALLVLLSLISHGVLFWALETRPSPTPPVPSALRIELIAASAPAAQAPPGTPPSPAEPTPPATQTAAKAAAPPAKPTRGKVPPKSLPPTVQNDQQLWSPIAASVAPQVAERSPRSEPATAVPAGAEAEAEARASAPPRELDLQPARYDHNPAPAYPDRARRLGLEGEVLLQAEVFPTGEPGAIKLQRPSGNTLLDRAALEAVRGWRFVPARRGAQSVASWVEIPIRFRLND